MAFNFGKFGNAPAQAGGAKSPSTFNFGNFSKVAEDRIYQKQLEDQAKRQERVDSAYNALSSSMVEYQNTQTKGVTGILNKVNNFFGRGVTTPVLADENPEYTQLRKSQEGEQAINRQATGQAIKPMNLLGGIKTGAESFTFGAANLLSDAVESVHYQLGGAKTIDEINKKNFDNQQNFLKAITKAKNITPQEKSKIIKGVMEASNVVKASDIYEFAGKDNKQIIGEAIGALADFLTLGTAEAAFKKALSEGGVKELAKFFGSKAGAQFLAEQSIAGMTQFGLGGLGMGLQQKKEGGDLAKEIGVNAAVGAVMQPAFALGGGLLGNLIKKYKGAKLFGSVVKEAEQKLGSLTDTEAAQLESHLAEGIDKEMAIKDIEVMRQADQPPKKVVSKEKQAALDYVNQTKSTKFRAKEDRSYTFKYDGKTYKDADYNTYQSWSNKAKDSGKDFKLVKTSEATEKYRLSSEEQDNLTTNVLKQLEGKDTVSKQFISDLTNRAEMKQVERDLIRNVLDTQGDKIDVKEFSKAVKSELLPLERTSTLPKNMEKNYPYSENTTRYESIALPDEVRGNVTNYSEHIYNSSIKTSAGDIHFPERSIDPDNFSDNYFGHTRIEDLPNDTRRVIEVQSDLYQKGGVEREKSAASWTSQQTDHQFLQDLKTDPSQHTFSEISKNEIKDTVDNLKMELEDAETVVERNITKQKIKLVQSEGKLYFPAKEKHLSQLDKLEQYNNPTAHFRMVREEIAKAAEDGKTALQFPTGETAMKIEGLGENTMVLRHVEPREGYGISIPNTETGKIIKDGELKVGLEYHPGTGGSVEHNTWIVTEVLGDGKFKAIPLGSEKMTLTEIKKSGVDIERITETFDLSGKVDTSNPIYKFYEKDLGKYLKGKYKATEVTDAKGVKWWEVKVKPEMKGPVEAFRLKDDFKRVAGIEMSDAQVKKLESLSKRIFGDTDVKILGQILTKDGREALGSHLKGMIKILRGQADAKGTFYHEAVHKYLDIFTTAEEHADLLLAAKKKFGAKDFKEAEEMLAEDFIKYAKSGEGVTGKLKVFYDKFIERIKAFAGNQDEIKKLYADIYTGEAKKGTPGAGKVSKAARDINQKIVEQGMKTLPEEELAKYTPITKNQTIADVTEQMANWEDSKKMALGEMPYSGKIQVLFNAVKNKAQKEGDIELLRQLANSPIATERSLHAQELGSAGFNNTPEDAVSVIQDVAKARKKNIGKKLRGKTVSQAKKTVVNNIKSEMKKTAPTKETWKSFIDSIKCK